MTCVTNDDSRSSSRSTLSVRLSVTQSLCNLKLKKYKCYSFQTLQSDYIHIEDVHLPFWWNNSIKKNLNANFCMLILAISIHSVQMIKVQTCNWSCFYYREKISNQRAGWAQNLDKQSWNKSIDHQQKKIQEELRLAAKASLAVSIVSEYDGLWEVSNYYVLCYVYVIEMYS